MREKILLFFWKRNFPYKGNVFKTKEEKSKGESEDESEDAPEEESENDKVKKFIEHIEKESKGLNYILLKYYFKYSVPSALVKELYETKNKNKNNKLVNVI